LISATGTITSTANITGGNIQTAGLISATGTITSAANITGGNIQTAGLISATGNISSAANITATANVTGGNIRTAGLISATGNITGGNISTAGILTVNSGNSAGAVIVNAGGNTTGNIGSSTGWFGNIFATSSKALYADLAECYLADATYIPGTVISVGGVAEVTQSSQDQDVLVTGVVSTKPAHLMNSGLDGEFVVAVALIGRVPCLVQGPVSRGAMMVSAGNGRARAEANPKLGSVIGKALESFDGDQGTIEIIVGRL
jgi:hypothetical protein